MTITIETLEAKKEELTKQFSELTEQLKKIEEDKKTVTNNALAVNGAIQLCDQLLAENKENENDGTKDES